MHYSLVWSDVDVGLWKSGRVDDTEKKGEKTSGKSETEKRFNEVNDTQLSELTSRRESNWR